MTVPLLQSVGLRRDQERFDAGARLLDEGSLIQREDGAGKRTNRRNVSHGRKGGKKFRGQLGDDGDGVRRYGMDDDGGVDAGFERYVGFGGSIERKGSVRVGRAGW